MLNVCAYGGAVGYFWCISFLCEFCFLYCDDVWLGAVYEVFQFLDFVSDAVYIDSKYDDVFFICLIVVCEWVGCDLLVMGCCVGVLMVHLQSGLYRRHLCAFQMNPVCVVCVVTSD